MGSAKPRTQADWDAWEREQRGLPPLKSKEPKPPKPFPTPDKLRARNRERKRRDAERHRKARATNVKARVNRRARQAPNKARQGIDTLNGMSKPGHAVTSNVVELKSVPTQPVTVSQKTQADQPATRPAEPNSMGDNELAVIAQCKGSRLAEERPATVSQCISLARILDNPEMSPMWPTTSRQLHSMLTSLQGPTRKKSRNRLQQVISMSAKTKAAQ
jgi:hypothetical protein